MDTNRLDKLRALKMLLETTQENGALIRSLSIYFLGESVGCSCKYNQTKSRLNQLWERELKKELEDYETAMD